MCGVSECDHEASIIRSWPTGGAVVLWSKEIVTEVICDNVVIVNERYYDPTLVEIKLFAVTEVSAT